MTLQRGYRLPNRKGYFPGFIAFIDSTEQQIPRLEDNKRRKAYYSGTKKKHTVELDLMVNNPRYCYA
jgi:hypothetical protein